MIDFLQRNSVIVLVGGFIDAVVNPCLWMMVPWGVV